MGDPVMKPYAALAVFVAVVILVIPSVIVLLDQNESRQVSLPSDKTKSVASPAFTVSVYRTDESRVVELPLEQYLIGVVASEMPAEFEIEALKAQALAARTYLFKQLLSDSPIRIPGGAEVTDSVMHQVYHDRAELRRLFGEDYDWKIKKITRAVRATRGEILTYQNEPITAAFFSTSNGYTETSGAIWPSNPPYLQSVPSPWDRRSPKFSHTMTMPLGQFEKKLGVQISDHGLLGTVLQKTPGNRVGKIRIGGKVFTGREVRQALSLPSTDFTFERRGDQVIVRTKGYGHGIGMSQYGANGMAKEGKNYRQIVQYYYRGVKISSMEPFTAKLVKK